MTAHSLENSVATFFEKACDPDRDRLQVPDLEWPPPSCPRCGDDARTIDVPRRDGRHDWRCGKCRLTWNSDGTGGHRDKGTPLDRVKEAHRAYARTEISAAAYFDAVDGFLEGK